MMKVTQEQLNQYAQEFGNLKQEIFDANFEHMVQSSMTIDLAKIAVLAETMYMGLRASEDSLEGGA